MNNFRSLQSRHEDLVGRAQSGKDIVEEVRKFIEDAKAGSSQISAANERDQLRANLRYWASYLYEQTQSYPNVDLAPSTVTKRNTWVLPVIIVVLILSGIGFGSTFLRNQSFNLPPSIGMTSTAAAYAFQLTMDAPTPIPTNTPKLVTDIFGDLATATPTSTSPPSNTLSIQLASVQDGDEVVPVMDLSGSYSSLSQGFSIRVIVQPASNSNRKLLMPESFPVEANSSGSWHVKTRFGEGEELKQKESYLIWVAFVADSSVDRELEKTEGTTFQDFPAGLFPFVGPILVNRPAYSDVIAGPRLVYSLYSTSASYSDIFSSDLNGKDVHAITNTDDRSELYPSVSPKGDKIVYVAGRRAGSNYVYSLEIVNSDGTSPQTIVGPQTNVTYYDRPHWSSDGNYIAYVFGNKNPNANNSLWNLAVYDLNANTPPASPPTALVQGNTENAHYISWIPSSTQIVYNLRAGGTAGFRSIDVLTKEDKEFYNEAREEIAPAVSPNGELLAYEDQSDGNIYVVELKTGKFTRVTDESPGTTYFCWGMDEKTIYYSTKSVEGVFRIWRITLEGKRIELMVDGQAPFVGELNALMP
jgi:hypothetical protein